jgi:hypothetical protein
VTAPFCQAIVISSIGLQLRCSLLKKIGRRTPASFGGMRRSAPSARQPHQIASRDREKGVAAVKVI